MRGSIRLGQGTFIGTERAVIRTGAVARGIMRLGEGAFIGTEGAVIRTEGVVMGVCDLGMGAGDWDKEECKEDQKVER